MLLVIDIGNTNTVLGVYDGEQLVAHWRLTTERSRTVDEYGIQFRNLFTLAALDPGKIGAVAISSVVPPLNYTLEKMSQVYFGHAPLFVDHKSNTGMTTVPTTPAVVHAAWTLFVGVGKRMRSVKNRQTAPKAKRAIMFA